MIKSKWLAKLTFSQILYVFFLSCNIQFVWSFFSDVLYLNVQCKDCSSTVLGGMCSTICAVLLKVISRSTWNLCSQNSADFHRIGTSVFYKVLPHFCVLKCFQLAIRVSHLHLTHFTTFCRTMCGFSKINAESAKNREILPEPCY